jgi:uncharacterized delta-60 repeat protein
MRPRRHWLSFKGLVLLAPLVLLLFVAFALVMADRTGGRAASSLPTPTAVDADQSTASSDPKVGSSQANAARSRLISERIVKASNQRGRNHLGQVLPISEFTLAAAEVDAWRSAAIGSEILLTNPDSRSIAARVTKSWEKDGRLNRVAKIAGGGSIGMTWSGATMSGLVQMPSINLAYRIVQSAPGQDAVVQEWLLSDVICSTPAGGNAPAPGEPVDLGLPLPEGHDPINASSSSQAAATVPVLQSRPGATAVIYIDFDGETVTDPLWADGDEIVAPPARLNSLQIREAWERVSKEFEVFDVNVTTSQADYDAAPANRRTRCIVSNVADQVYPGAGGVAYLNSFTGILSPVCWAFIDTNPKYCADVVSHEVGHTLDLNHDGREATTGAPREEYYGGHGTGVTGWAPIMGVGYYKNLVQWSKGEYARANNPEDDLAIMSAPAKIPFIADDAPAAPDGSETPLTPGSAPVAGGIGNPASNDADVFRANLAPGSYRVNMQPVPHANLDAKIEVLDAGLNVLVSGNPLDLLTADARFRLDAPGTVYFRASGTGKIPVTGSGYSAYSSFGSYTLELTSVFGDLLETVTGPSADDFVQSLAMDEGSRIYLAGNFGQIDGTARSKVARLTANGTLDPTFNSGTGPNGQVRSAVFSSRDRGLYIGGDFTAVAGTSRVALARLAVGKTGLSDGALDPDFAPIFAASSTGAPAYIQAIVLQDDGKLLVGGFFSSVNGQPRENLARLLPDGTLDEEFDAPVGGAVQAIALQVDGKIYVGGSFGQVHGAERNRLARLHRNGVLDTNFDVGSGPTGGFDGTVNSLATTLDQEVIVGGQFSRYNGRAFYNNVAKLQSDGRVSPKFNYTPGLNGAVRRVIVRPGGQILLAGHFTQVGNSALGLAGTPAGRIVQLQADGSLDANFNPNSVGASGTVLDAVAMASGNILAAGAFTSFNGSTANRLAVISGFDTAVPIITSPLSRNIDAGGELDHLFTSSVTGPAQFELLDSRGNPATLPPGLSFDAATRRLSGIPLQAGTFEFFVRVTPAAPGSAASESTRFVLVINTAPVSFARWQQAFAPDVNPGDSPDTVRGASGLSDYMIYAMSGMNPVEADAGLQPLVQTEEIDGARYLTLTASKYPAASDSKGNPLVYRVEFSDDLHEWKSGGTSVTVISETASQIRARATTPASTSGPQFLRLKVLASNPL